MNGGEIKIVRALELRSDMSGDTTVGNIIGDTHTEELAVTSQKSTKTMQSMHKEDEPGNHQ